MTADNYFQHGMTMSTRNGKQRVGTEDNRHMELRGVTLETSQRIMAKEMANV